MVFAHFCESRFALLFPNPDQSDLPGFGLGEITGVSDYPSANNHSIWQKLSVNCMCPYFRKTILSLPPFSFVKKEFSRLNEVNVSFPLPTEFIYSTETVSLLPCYHLALLLFFPIF